MSPANSVVNASPLTPRRALVAFIISFAMLIAGMSAATPASAITVLPKVTTLENTLANAMLGLLNLERRANGKPAVLGSSLLRNSARGHDVTMAKYDQMAHQCSGEAAPGTRITLAGYRWRAWGENIGWTTLETEYGLLQLEKYMYGERPPNNGHRLNILGNFRNVGIDVYLDPVHLTMWFTQDFGTPL